MELNLIALGLISLIPLAFAAIWYNPSLGLSTKAGIPFSIGGNPLKWILFFICSYALMFVYVNLIIHQVGFYELFFTDIMRGSVEAKEVAEAFLAEYGDKHRHFGHGAFHGAILGTFLALPFLAILYLTDGKSLRWVLTHFGYWMITSIVTGGLIAEFV